MIPECIFSQTRGTAKKISGRTSGRYCAICPPSGQVETS